MRILKSCPWYWLPELKLHNLLHSFSYPVCQAVKFKFSLIKQSWTLPCFLTKSKLKFIIETFRKWYIYLIIFSSHNYQMHIAFLWPIIKALLRQLWLGNRIWWKFTFVTFGWSSLCQTATSCKNANRRRAISASVLVPSPLPVKHLHWKLRLTS